MGYGNLPVRRWIALPGLFLATLLLAGMASHELRKFEIGLPAWHEERLEDRLIPLSLMHSVQPSTMTLESLLQFPHIPELDQSGESDVSGLDASEADEIDAFEPESADAESVDEISSEDTGWNEITIREGDSLSLIFSRLGLNNQDLDQIISLGKETACLKDLKPHQNLEIFIQDGKLNEIWYKPDYTHTLHVYKTGERFTANTETTPQETRVSMTTVSIGNSLFLAGQAAGLSDRLIMRLMQVFRWDIDFTEIQEGDSFALIYEEIFQGERKVKDGKILAAEFTQQGKTYRAVRHEGKDGKAEYFSDPEGRGLRKAFLRTPVQFTRITSYFTNRRRHPILHTIRAHKGVDYAAPTGTPIKAAGDGKVRFVGWQGGYGRTIVIEHGNTYSTLYGHLSRTAKSLKAGQTVSQGQVIGYVGRTGLATGPHLHYEFRVNGVHQNPLTVKLPESTPLEERRLVEFKKESNAMFAKLEMLTGTHARGLGSESNVVKSRVIQ